jgi:hypothetical protein
VKLSHYFLLSPWTVRINPPEYGNHFDRHGPQGAVPVECEFVEG